MPCWYYEKDELKNTPSALDGVNHETEMRYRAEGAKLIIDMRHKMNLGYNTMATGVVYYHRFYMFHSFRQFPRFVTACCCLFLAGKVEETPKKCKDIIRVAKTMLSEQKFQTFGQDPKDEVMTMEQILLQTIKFDLQVEHPYSFLLTYSKCLVGKQDKLQEMAQMAWNFVNDSLCTTLTLQWEPEILAVAMIHLACKMKNLQVNDWVGRTSKHSKWWDMFIEDIGTDLLEDICHQMLDYYISIEKAKSIQESPPTATHSESPPPVTPPVTPKPKSSTSTPKTNGVHKIEPVENTPPPKPQISQPQATLPPPEVPVAPIFPYQTIPPPYPYAPAHIAPPPPPPNPMAAPPPMALYPPPFPQHFPQMPPPNIAFYPPPGPPPMPPQQRPPYYR